MGHHLVLDKKLDQFRVSSVFRERRAGRVTQFAQAAGGRTNDPEVAMDQYLFLYHF